MNRLKPKYGFAKTLSAIEMGQRYEQGDISSVEKNCSVIADELQQYGFNMVDAPVVDLNINPQSPAIGSVRRSFSQQPDTVTECAKIYINACKQRGIQCILKHFPGHGSATTDSHKGFTDITATWSTEELAPYIALANHCGAVMMAHIIHHHYDNKPASISAYWVNKLRQLPFNGIIVADDLQMSGLANYFSQQHQHNENPDANLHQAIIASLKAGCDLLYICNHLTTFNPNRFTECVQAVKDAVQSGELRQSDLNASYQRIQKMKNVNRP